MLLVEELKKKWAPILDHKEIDPITDRHKKYVTATMLENTQQSLQETSSSVPVNSMGSSSSVAGSGGIDTFDPVLISLIRRAMPQLIAYDICGVQPMTGPTGLIFAMRSRYNGQTGDEAFYNEANTAFSTVTSGNTAVFGQGFTGTFPGGSNASPLTAVNTYNTGVGMSTSQGESLGADTSTAFPQMAFSIEKIAVTATTRAMKAEYSTELAQDLKAIHGLDAETELSNILSAEILAEINREVVRTINITAVVGAQYNTTTPGIFDLDTDSNGRWSVEKFKGLIYNIQRECNAIARQTRRGLGNIMICSSDVASALQMAEVLDYTPALATKNLQVDDTGNTFAGVMNGRIKVYIDPYAIGGNYVTVGYKGSNSFDAGLFYCPYIPLQMVRAVDQGTFQPKIGFKTRYGIVANPFAEGFNKGAGRANTLRTNVYYRNFVVQNLL